MSQIEEEVGALAALSSAQLRNRWQMETGRAAPRVSPSMLRLALAWEIQARCLGGLSPSTVRTLDQLAMAKSGMPNPPPLQRLVREWRGSVHVVTIDQHKTIRWDGREWRSLSEVAREITGTRWSGPAFFGLKRKDAA